MKRTGITRKKGMPRYGSRIRQVSAKRAAKAGAWQHLRVLVHAREGGSCASCGTSTPLSVGECHHRLLRSQGGQDNAETCVWLCRSCHAAAHHLPGTARRLGWIVPRGQDPAAYPVRRHHHGRNGYWQPSESGWVPASPHPEQVRLLDLNGESA